jgi:hypothetical protein
LPNSALLQPGVMKTPMTTGVVSAGVNEVHLHCEAPAVEQIFARMMESEPRQPVASAASACWLLKFNWIVCPLFTIRPR